MEKANRPVTSDDEIDLLELAKTVWDKKRLLVSIAIVFAVLGILVALVLQNEFTAESTFVPQTSEQVKVGGGLGGLASLAGINLGGLAGGSEIPPSLSLK
jgi:LPS O-antigen subunit length determinant protein (WzzB/FepE family)